MQIRIYVDECSLISHLITANYCFSLPVVWGRKDCNTFASMANQIAIFFYFMTSYDMTYNS